MTASAARAAALSLLLPDFGAAPAQLRVVPAAAPPPEPKVDAEALAAAAVAEAEAALRAQLDAEHQAEITRLRAAHAAELAQAEAAAGALLGGGVAAAIEALERRLSAGLSRGAAVLLLPLAGEAAAQRAGEALAAAVQSALEDRRRKGGGPPLVTARGPRALWAALSARLEEAGIPATWEEAPGPDIAVCAGDELWETRLGEVMAEARAALADAGILA